MAKYEILVASEAERDLRDMYDYIATKLGSPRAAREELRRGGPTRRRRGD